METVYATLVTLAIIGAVFLFVRGLRVDERHEKLGQAVLAFLVEVEKAGFPPCWPGPCHRGNCRTPDWCNRLAALYAQTGRTRPRVGSDGRPVGEREGRMV